MAMEEDDKSGNNGAVEAAIRSAKKFARPTKIGVRQTVPRNQPKKKSRTKGALRTGSAFERDLERNIGHGEGVRAKKGDAVAGMGKKGGKKKGK
jgi:ATP-dependent RNA helicase DDX27